MADSIRFSDKSVKYNDNLFKIFVANNAHIIWCSPILQNILANSILFNNKAQTNKFFSGYLTSLDPNETINNISEKIRIKDIDIIKTAMTNLHSQVIENISDIELLKREEISKKKE